MYIFINRCIDFKIMWYFVNILFCWTPMEILVLIKCLIKSLKNKEDCSHRENHSLENWVNLQPSQENRADQRENRPSPSFLPLFPPLQEVGNLRWRTYRSFQDKHGILIKSVHYQTWLETDLSGRMARRPYSPDSLAALSRLWSLPPRSCGCTWSRRRSTAPSTHQPRSSERMNSGIVSFWFNLDFA